MVRYRKKSAVYLLCGISVRGIMTTVNVDRVILRLPIQLFKFLFTFSINSQISGSLVDLIGQFSVAVGLRTRHRRHAASLVERLRPQRHLAALSGRWKRLLQCLSLFYCQIGQVHTAGSSVIEFHFVLHYAYVKLSNYNIHSPQQYES